MKNIITNKDPKQAAAIAYSVQRENNNKVRDSFTYRMFGTTGPKDVKGLTLEEAKKLLKNNRLLGYDGEILDESTGNLIKDGLTEYQIVYKGKVLRTLYSLSEARYVKSSYIKMGMYVEIIETSTGRRIDCMKKFKVHYDCRSFIVNAKDSRDAATKVINKVKDDGKLVSKYIKKLPDGRPVPSAIVEHPNGYTFISAIVKEDRDFINLYLAEEYAKRLGYVKTNDSAIKDSNFDTVKNVFNKYGVDIIKVVNKQDGSKAIYFDKKDKDIYNKPEIVDLYRSGKLRYAGSGYFVEVLDSSSIKDSNLSNAYAELKKYYPNAQVSMSNNTLIIKNIYELGSGIKNFLTNLNKKYGRPVPGFGGRPTNEPIITNNEALLLIKDSAIKDTFEIYQNDLYKVILDGSWVEITNRKGETIYSGNTTARTAKEAFEIAKKKHIVDSEIKDESDLQLLRNYFSENQPNKKMELRTKLKSMGYEEGVSGVNSRELMWVKLNGKKYEVKNLKNVTPLDSAIKDESNEEKYKKELAYWQDLYMNRKLITSSELSTKAAELRKKYNIKDKAFRVTHKDKTFTVVAKDKKDAALKIAKHISK